MKIEKTNCYGKFFTTLLIAALSCSMAFAQQTQKLRYAGKPFTHTPRPDANARNACPSQPVYRTLDGTCNNVSDPSRCEWGAADIGLARELPAVYGQPDPLNSLNGQDRPNPRDISNRVCDQPYNIRSAEGLTSLIFTWGQFLDHDIGISPEGEEDASIPVPPNDPLFAGVIPFHRSDVLSGTGQNGTPRNQRNLITSWVDASNVYGSDATRAAWLRTFQDGKLKTSSGNLLPYNTVDGELTSALDPTAPGMAGDVDFMGSPAKVFVAGDIRANEQSGLTAMHTLFMREHNRICDQLVISGMTDDEEIYQNARKQVIATVQLITYYEFLPALGIQTNTDLTDTYDPTVQPDIFNIFSAGAYRIGHTMVSSSIPLRDDNCNEVGVGSISLFDAFFNPSIIQTNGIEPVLKGLSEQNQQEIDVRIVDDLRNFLFGPNSGLDLATFNIQRGRDHGLPDYNTIRFHFTGSVATSFSDITSDPVFRDSLESVYGNVNNVDAWVGMLAEDHLFNSSVGGTLHEILKEQFARLRDGDYYFFTRYPEYTTLPFVSENRLRDVLNRNTTSNYPDLPQYSYYPFINEGACANQCPDNIASISNQGNYCQGQSIQLFGGSSLPGAQTLFTWTGPNGFLSYDQNAVIPNANATHEGIYTLVVTVDDCESQPVTTAVTVTGAISVPITGPATVEVGSSIVVTANPLGGTPPYTFDCSIFVGPDKISLVDNGDGTATVTGLTEGFAQVDCFATDATGCSGVGWFSLNVVPPACRTLDSLTLVEFYNATNGPGWINTWNLAQPMDTWFGVTLTAEGCVQKLFLNNNNISGTLPPVIGNLYSLTDLALDDNNLMGSLPVEIGQLSNLQWLYMNNNQLTGSIPAVFGGLSNLLYLGFENNELTGDIPTDLGGLSNMFILLLSGNQLSGSIPAELVNLTNLTSLWLDNNQLSGAVPVGLTNIPNLIRVTLQNNSLTFAGMEALPGSGIIIQEYAQQATIPLVLNDDIFSVDAGGTIANNTYNWYLNGVLVATIVGDNSYMPVDTGDYHCEITNSIVTNAGAPLQNLILVSETVSYAGAFCEVWPGDMNNDGVVNQQEFLYWSLAAGNTGPARSNPSISWVGQQAQTWDEAARSINNKFQDTNGDGLIDAADLQAVDLNFGQTHPVTGTSSSLIYADHFRLDPLPGEVVGTLRYGLYMEETGIMNGVYGVAGIIYFNTTATTNASLDVTNSALSPDVFFERYDAANNLLHFALTGSDYTNRVFGADDAIAILEVNTGSLAAGQEITFTVSAGTNVNASGTFNSMAGSSGTILHNEVPPNSNNMLLNASVVHEQCNRAGRADVLITGGVAPYTIAWNNGETTTRISSLNAGTYEVTVTDANNLSAELVVDVLEQYEILYDENGIIIECLPLACPSILTLGNNLATGTQQANTIITSDATIPTGEDVMMKAGNFILLNAGFNVEPGANFSAEIEGCNNN